MRTAVVFLLGSTSSNYRTLGGSDPGPPYLLHAPLSITYPKYIIYVWRPETGLWQSKDCISPFLSRTHIIYLLYIVVLTLHIIIDDRSIVKY